MTNKDIILEKMSKNDRELAKALIDYEEVTGFDEQPEFKYVTYDGYRYKYYMDALEHQLKWLQEEKDIPELQDAKSKINKIKSLLIEANRMDDILSILDQIISLEGYDFVVQPFTNCNGQIETIIKGENIRREAIILKGALLSPSDNVVNGATSINTNGLLNLLKYMEHMTDMVLHNYAVCISHKKETYIDMDKIRGYLILTNILQCWYIESDFNDYSIPYGWKKIEEE